MDNDGGKAENVNKCIINQNTEAFVGSFSYRHFFPVSQGSELRVK